MLRWSGLPVVYLRPTAFFEIFLIQAAKGIRETTGRGNRERRQIPHGTARLGMPEKTNKRGRQVPIRRIA